MKDAHTPITLPDNYKEIKSYEFILENTENKYRD